MKSSLCALSKEDARSAIQSICNQKLTEVCFNEVSVEVSSCTDEYTEGSVYQQTCARRAFLDLEVGPALDEALRQAAR